MSNRSRSSIYALGPFPICVTFRSSNHNKMGKVTQLAANLNNILSLARIVAKILKRILNIRFKNSYSFVDLLKIDVMLVSFMYQN